MTRNVCLIGDSHLAMMKLGWEKAGAVTEQYAPVYFGAPGSYLGELGIQDGKLVAPSEISRMFARLSGGTTEIAVADFDAFLVVGSRMRLRSVIDIYQTHRLAAHVDGNQQIISDAALKLAVLGALRASAAYRNVKQLRKLTDAPIFLVPEPLPNLLARTNQATRALWSGDYVPMLKELYSQALVQLAQELSATLILQPAHTVAEDCFTQPGYGIGSVRMDGKVKQPEGEVWHMNADFGALMLHQALAA